MANEKRKRQEWIGGLVEDNPLTAGDTLLTSAGLAAITGGVASTEHMAIILDPDGVDGAPEIAYITALTAGTGATGATGLARGKEGTTAREHKKDTPWVHGPTVEDETAVYVVGSDSAGSAVNPMPTVETLVESLTVTLPASTCPKWAVVSASVEHNDPSAARRFHVFLDSVQRWPSSASGEESKRESETASDGYTWHVGAVGLAIPGDAAAHTIEIRWEAQSNTNSTTPLRRWMEVLVLPRVN